jgi:hypothetical protein
LPARRAVVFYLDDQTGRAKKTRVMLCDVTQGTILVQQTVEGAFLPLDLDAEGIRVLFRQDSYGTGKKDTAGIWTLAGGGPPTIRQWVPYADESRDERDILWAAFAGAGRVATLSSGGRLVLWNTATLRPICTIPASPAMPAVSPNGNYLAFLRETQAGLLDVTTGEVVSFLPLGSDLRFAALAFRPDGQALLCAAKDKVLILDVTSGRVQTTTVPGITGQGLHPVPSVGWADDRLLFVNGYLVDPEVPVPIWHYMCAWSRPGGGHVWFLASKGFEEAALVPLRLPHPAAVRKIMAARADSGDFLLKPGDAVQIDVRQVPKEHQRDAQRALESALQQTNYRPAATAPLVVEVVPGRERFEDHTYTISSMFGAGAARERRETHRIRVQTVNVRLLKEGKEIWNKPHFEITPGAPFFISMATGETAAEKLAPYSLSDYRRLEKLELPKFLQLQLGRGVTRMSLGHSTVGPDGIDERLQQTRERLEQMKKRPAKPMR